MTQTIQEIGLKFGQLEAIASTFGKQRMRDSFRESLTLPSAESYSQTDLAYLLHALSLAESGISDIPTPALFFKDENI